MSGSTLADKIITFNESLEFTAVLPEGVEVMNPFREETVKTLTSLFYRKFYDDNQPRRLILGINPGRFGAGVTGIPFTDPVKLEVFCGIANPFPKTSEASAGFIYEMISAYGGVGQFYHDFFIGAVSPLGFLKNGLNYNYYDSKELMRLTEPFIVSSLRKMLEWNISNRFGFCLGNGKNYSFLKKLNDRLKLFEEIVPLPHPRWVVQYRRKRMDEFVDDYLTAFQRFSI